MIIAKFHPHIGGAERQALQLARRLIDRGVSVDVLTRKTNNLPACETIQGVPVYRSIRTLNRGKCFGVSYMLSVAAFLLFKGRAYDIIHCHVCGLHAVAGVLMRPFLSAGVLAKAAIAGPDSDFRQLEEHLFGKHLIRIVCRLDCLVAICRDTREEAVRAGISRDKTAFIPNGVDCALFRPAAGLPRGSRIVCAGSLVRRKGFHVVIAAVRHLHERGIRAALDIVGEGHERQNLEAAAHSGIPEGAVRFHGSRENILPWLRSASVCVIASFAEGLPNILLEAMACGLPVVATAVGGITDVIQHGENGILVEPASAQQLASALEMLFKDPQKAQRLGARARKTVEAQYCLDAVADKYLHLYDRLAGKADKGS
jgi:glycosyltransferase involved in cell wall biosynthesis